MKILSLHCDYIKFQAKKKAIKDAEPSSDKETEVKECLVILTAVEKRDEKNIQEISKRLSDEIKDIAKQVKTKNIVLYPYAHLSSRLANPQKALEILKITEKLLSKDFKVTRAPFGYYKTFEILCKGHPLAELSREFSTEKESEEEYDYKQLLNEISKTRLSKEKLKENDHRIIGQQLNLFSFSEIAPGMVFWHPKGLIIKNELIDFWKEEHKKAGYLEISTPIILDKKLWQISGHWEKYKDNIFITEYDKRTFAVKPMNCPGGILVYKSQLRSYRDFPLKFSELGIVHRQELSGVLGGLFRVIQFIQDDAHIYCTEEQLEEEINNVFDLTEKIYNAFNLSYHVELSTRPKKRIGDDDIWDKAEKALENVLKKRKAKYKLNKGEGSFYGPKIDFHIKDSLGRTWQCGTIQVDFSMPERFNLTYEGKDGKKHMPIMIHRAIYGSLERFMGILLENFNGKLPLWLNPNQVKVITVNERNNKFGEDIFNALKNEGIRVEFDDNNETISKKVREAQLSRFNYVITIGDKEEDSNALAVRTRNGDVRFNVRLNEFIREVKEKAEKKENA
ncbi:threonine--tRNA ligase [Candidatus Woesearchaeota archaeon]|nr:threonine--tRNA ligase [Candidatus Woesearchaeota archaeon]